MPAFNSLCPATVFIRFQCSPLYSCTLSVSFHKNDGYRKLTPSHHCTWTGFKYRYKFNLIKDFCSSTHGIFGVMHSYNLGYCCVVSLLVIILWFPSLYFTFSVDILYRSPSAVNVMLPPEEHSALVELISGHHKECRVNGSPVCARGTRCLSIKNFL